MTWGASPASPFVEHCWRGPDDAGRLHSACGLAHTINEPKKLRANSSRCRTCEKRLAVVAGLAVAPNKGTVHRRATDIVRDRSVRPLNGTATAAAGCVFITAQSWPHRCGAACEGQGQYCAEHKRIVGQPTGAMSFAGARIQQMVGIG